MSLNNKEIGHIRVSPSNGVVTSNIEPEYIGLGLGKKMYGEALKRRGTLYPDPYHSEQAERVWKSLFKRYPNVSSLETKLKGIAKLGYAPSAGPWTGEGAASEPPSGYSTTLLEENKTQGEDAPDPNVEKFKTYEKDTTIPWRVPSAETDMMARRRADFMRKRAEYTPGVPTPYVISTHPSDMGIGGASGATELLLPSIEHMQNVYDDWSPYRNTDFSNAENPASIAVARTPILDRLRARRIDNSKPSSYNRP
jgi:hypothetical protein